MREAVEALDRITQQIRQDPHLKSPHTRRAYLADLAAFEAWRSGRPLTRLLVEQYAAELQDARKAPETINRHLAALRWWIRRQVELAREDPALESSARDHLVEQAERAAGVEAVRGSRPPRGRHITAGELRALLDACQVDPTPAGARDAALICLAWASGARRDELGSLTLADFRPTGAAPLPSIDLAISSISGEGELSIRGKGDKARLLPVYNGAFEALADWLKVRGSAPGPLFCTISRWGRLGTRRLQGEPMRLLLDKRIAEARIKPLTWHDFRRTFAGNLLDQGADLATVQRLMGHASPITTSGYDRRGLDARRAAVKKLFIPYSRR
jgi:site-specific recombinase XerD